MTAENATPMCEAQGGSVMDAEGIRLASIERVVQGGGQVSNNGAQFLLDRLRAAEAERDGTSIVLARTEGALDKARARAAEAEAEALRKKTDYEWQLAQVDELAVDVSLLEEQHEDDLKALAEAEAVIAEAPHAPECPTKTPHWNLPCNCWKSRYRAGAEQ